MRAGQPRGPDRTIPFYPSGWPIGLAVLAGRFATRPGGPRRTFGFQRSEVMAALLNGLALVAIAVVIVVDCGSRDATASGAEASLTVG